MDNHELNEQEEEDEDEDAAIDTEAEVEVGMTRNEAISKILNTFDVEYAGDRTGQVDYASIRSGGKIIYESRGTELPGTTQELVDTLPIINRIMSKTLNLRFYGHGPEAALSVTHPRDALGQCWAFVVPLLSKDGENNNDTCGVESGSNGRSCGSNSGGDIATLTVKLAKPLRVESVVIEHPPKELTPHFDTAIRDFRVIGYDDINSRFATAYDLGSFTYDIDGLQSLQEFKMQQVDDDGTDLPKMEYIVLAIDRNWGSEISCLYRFRVHGAVE